MNPESFVPMDRRHSLATGMALPSASRGVVLSVDMCSSTPLVEELVSRLGEREGAEAFGDILNQLFGSVIECVHAQHGSAISFAGDSVQCWFDGPAELSALQAAMDVRRVSYAVAARLDLGDGGSPFAIRTAVCGGEGIRLVVGEPELQQLDLLVGSATIRADEALKACPTGEILIDSEVLAAVAHQITVHRCIDAPCGRFGVLGDMLASVAPRPWQPPRPIARVNGRWVAKVVEEHAQSLGTSLFGTIRTPVVIFLRFNGSVHSGEVSHQQLKDWTARVQRVLDELDGVLLQVTSDAKGTYLYGAFGALSAHEDDSNRAVRAAEILSHSDPLRSFTAGVAISRGSVFVGVYGAAARASLGVVGRDVHLAARLMEQAKSGQVLVTERVAREASSFSFELHQACPIRGFAEPIQVLELRARSLPSSGPRPRHARVPGIVGREAERFRIHRRLEAAVVGAGGMVVLEGEPGSGKSRLLQELLESAESRGLPVLSIAGDVVERSAPFFAWRPLMQKVLGLNELEPNAWNEQLLSAAEKAQIPAHQVILLRAVVGLSISDDSSIRHMPPEGRAVRTRALVSMLLRVALQQARAALLIVEDAHWLDEGSSELLIEVVRGIPELLAVVAVRPSEGADTRNCLSALPEAERIRLRPLAPGELDQMARMMLGVEEVGPDVQELLVECSGGNPFFAQEVLAHLVETRRLVVAAGVAQLANSWSTSERPLPGTIQDLLVSRVDHLPVDEQSVLRVASIAGLVFADRFVHRALGCDADQRDVDRCLKTLRERGVVERQSEGVHVFRHALIRDAVYSMLLESQRARLHRMAADWLRNHTEKIISPHLASIAHHLERSRDFSEAVRFLVEAAEQASSVFANDEAARQLERALELTHHHRLSVSRETIARWQLRAAEALIKILRYRAANRRLAQGLHGLGHHVPKGNARTLLRLLGQVTIQALHRAMPSYFVGRRRQSAERLLTVARALEGSVESAFLLGHRLLAYHHAFASLNAAEAAGSSPELARAYVSMGDGLGFAGLHRWARAYLKRADHVVASIDHPPSTCFVEILSGFYSAGLGAWSESLPRLTHALKVADEIGDPRRVSDALSVLVPSMCLLGRLEEARAHADRLVETNLRGPYVRNLCESLYLRTVVALLSGDLRMAERDHRRLDSTLTAYPEVVDDVLLVYRFGIESLLRLESQEWDLAVASAEKTVAIARRQDPLIFSSLWAFAGAGCVLAAVARRQPRVGTANCRALKRALRSSNRLASVFPVARPAALRLEAEWLAIIGRSRKALATSERAAALATSLQMPIEAALGWVAAARIRVPESGKHDVTRHFARECLGTGHCERRADSIIWNNPYV